MQNEASQVLGMEDINSPVMGGQGPVMNGPEKPKDEPKNTGLFFFVNNTYTSVPTPAPTSAAAGLMPLPTMTGTTRVAAMIARSCWKAKTST